MTSLYSTNLDIEKYVGRFQKTTCKLSSFNFKVKVPCFVEDNQGKIYGSFLIRVRKSGVGITLKEPFKNMKVIEMDSKTHMRSFEVIETEKIARGQGICCVYIEKCKLYMKLIYDKTKDCGVDFAQYTRLASACALKDVLNGDLSNGWSFFFVNRDKTVDHLCENPDKRDDAILFSDLRDTVKYPNKKSKVEDVE